MRVVAAILMLAGCTFEARGPNVHTDGGDPDAAPADAIGDSAPDAAPAITCSYVTKLGGHSYRFTAGARTWDAARADCAADTGHLVKIDGVAEDDFVTTTVSGATDPYVWIGLHDEAQNDTYVWFDRAPLGYENFNAGAPPMSASLNCVDKSTANVDGTWYAVSCTGVKRGICECDRP